MPPGRRRMELEEVYKRAKRIISIDPDVTNFQLHKRFQISYDKIKELRAEVESANKKT